MRLLGIILFACIMSGCMHSGQDMEVYLEETAALVEAGDYAKEEVNNFNDCFAKEDNLLDGYDLSAYLDEIRMIQNHGEYAEALKRYIYLYENSRFRSYSVLDYWWNMGVVYPPAREAFLEMRDQGAKKLKQGEGGLELFLEVLVLYSVSEEKEKRDEWTYKIFLVLDEEYPQLAKESWVWAKRTVIGNKNYDLAKKYMLNLMTEFEEVVESYKQHLEFYDDPVFKDDPEIFDIMMEHTEDTFTEDSLQLIEVAVAWGELDTAKKIQQKALEVLDDERLKVDFNTMRDEIGSITHTEVVE